MPSNSTSSLGLFDVLRVMRSVNGSKAAKAWRNRFNSKPPKDVEVICNRLKRDFFVLRIEEISLGVFCCSYSSDLSSNEPDLVFNVSDGRVVSVRRNKNKTDGVYETLDSIRISRFIFDMSGWEAFKT